MASHAHAYQRWPLEPFPAERTSQRRPSPSRPVTACAHAGVQPPGDPRVAQVVGAAHERRGELLRGKGEPPDLPPDLPPSGGLDRVASLAAEQPPILAGAEPLYVVTQQGDQFGRDGHIPGGPSGCGVPRASLEPAGLMHLAVVGEIPPGRWAGVGEDQPPPALARRWQLALTRAVTSEGRIMA